MKVFYGYALGMLLLAAGLWQLRTPQAAKPPGLNTVVVGRLQLTSLLKPVADLDVASVYLPPKISFVRDWPEDHAIHQTDLQFMVNALRQDELARPYAHAILFRSGLQHDFEE